MAVNEQAMMQMAADLEVEMMSDMYKRMSAACQRKCVQASYKDADLSKAESVCLDRCVAKYMDVHDRLGRKLTTMSQTDEAALQQQAQAQ